MPQDVVAEEGALDDEGNRPDSLAPAAVVGAGRIFGHLPGVALVLVATAASLALAGVVPVPVSALTVAIVLGVVVRNAGLLPTAAEAGAAWSTKRMLRAGVVLLGLQLSVPDLLELGAGDVLTILATVAVTFCATVWAGRWMGVGRRLSLLLATGFSICGASAVAAMSSVVRSDERRDEDTPTAIAMVTLWGSVLLVALPLGQGLLRLDDRQMGVLVGVSVHEVAQVVAAGSAVSATALAVAVVVKLGRVVLLAPLVAMVGGVERRRRRRTARGADGGMQGDKPALVPLFVLGFLAMVLVRSTGLVPEGALDVVGIVGSALLTGAMFGLGAGVQLASLVRVGGQAALLGGVSTAVAVAVGFVGVSLT